MHSIAYRATKAECLDLKNGYHTQGGIQLQAMLTEIL